MVRQSPAPQLTAVDLFCGAGGLTEGLSQAGFDVVVAADHDPDACATHRLNFPQAILIEGDLSKRPNHEALVAASGRRRLDLLAGGPPCQAFSQIHNHDRLIEDPRNRFIASSWLSFANYVRARCSSRMSPA